MAKCRECKTGTLKIMGTSGFGDLIEVECQNPDCGECYEVEQDGLGMGGLEFVDAQMIDSMKMDMADAQMIDMMDDMDDMDDMD